MEKIRVIRGEFYTQFLQEAKQVVKAAGRRFQIHIEDHMGDEPDVSTPMEIHWDWKKWLEKVKPDEVTFKVQNFRAYREHFGRELIARCQAASIPVYFTPVVASFIEQELDAYVEEVRQSGCSGFDIYENAAFIVPNEDGSFREKCPKLIRFLESKAGQKKNDWRIYK